MKHTKNKKRVQYKPRTLPALTHDLETFFQVAAAILNQPAAK